MRSLMPAAGGFLESVYFYKLNLYTLFMHNDAIIVHGKMPFHTPHLYVICLMAFKVDSVRLSVVGHKPLKHAPDMEPATACSHQPSLC